VLKIVRRTCYSWLERNRPADVVSLEVEEEFGNAVATSVIDAEALLESRSDLRRLDQLIEALPVPLRETIVLRELHELGYRQIAEVTGVPIGTVMSRLHRARSLLFRAWDTTDVAERTGRQAQLRMDSMNRVRRDVIRNGSGFAAHTV
jgi:RNA polymerase sigma-70 factor (ECF subfamily)